MNSLNYAASARCWHLKASSASLCLKSCEWTLAVGPLTELAPLGRSTFRESTVRKPKCGLLKHADSGGRFGGRFLFGGLQKVRSVSLHM